MAPPPTAKKRSGVQHNRKMKSPTKKVARPTAKMSQLVSNIQSTFEVDAKTIDLKRKINEGNFGTVWLAVWKRKEMGDMEVAVKQMKARGKKEMEDLKNELPLLFRAASHCNNVCKLHGITELDGKLSIIMTYYSGGNIGEYMVDYKKRKGENLPWGKIRKFCLAVCRGMQELHDNRMCYPPLPHPLPTFNSTPQGVAIGNRQAKLCAAHPPDAGLAAGVGPGGKELDLQPRSTERTTSCVGERGG